MPGDAVAAAPHLPFVLRWIHLIAGVAGLATFAVTGQHMDSQLGHLAGMPDGPRVLYRSAHIYLLLCALLHVALGLHLAPAPHVLGRTGQVLGSALLLAALGGFVYGFYVETPLGLIERPALRHSIYGCLAGVLVHGVVRLSPGWRAPTA